MSYKPSHILGLKDRGFLAPWARADLVLIDPDAAWTAGKEDFHSRSRNSPFIGQNLKGKVLLTLHGGNIVLSRLPALPV